MELVGIFESSLHKHNNRQERIEAFLAEISDIPTRSSTYFYDARYLRQTAASELIKNHQDIEVQACVIQAAKRLWKDSKHKNNAFELCRLPERLLGDKTPAGFLETTYRQISFWLPDRIKSSGKDVTALLPFFNHEQTAERARVRAANILNIYGVKTDIGAAALLEEWPEFIHLPGLELGNADIIAKQAKQHVSIKTPQSKLDLNW